MIVLDVTEGTAPRLRGWSRYVRELALALGDAVPPRRAARPRAELLPPAAPAVPRRRDHPRPRVRGVPVLLRPADAAEVPVVRAARRTVGGAGDRAVAVHGARRRRALRRAAVEGADRAGGARAPSHRRSSGRGRLPPRGRRRPPEEEPRCAR